jgi:hypothetical protein
VSLFRYLILPVRFELTTVNINKATKTALIFGATGQTGQHLLRELIASPTFSRVCEAGRRVTPVEELSADARGKLEQKVIDFERLDEAGLKDSNWDVVFITSVPFFASRRCFSIYEWSTARQVGNKSQSCGFQGKFLENRQGVRDASFLGSPLLTLSSCAGMSSTQRTPQR